MATQDETRTFTIQCPNHLCRVRTPREFTAMFGLGDERTEWHGTCEDGHDIVHVTPEPLQSLADATPYRVRVRPYRVIRGERVPMGEGWIKGFASAMAAATYWYRAAFKIGNCLVDGTRPAEDGRAWVTRDELLRIARNA
jgi:hypothetical protein